MMSLYMVVSCLVVVSWRLVMKNREEGNLMEQGGKKDMRGVDGRKTVVGRYCVRKESIFN